MNAWDRSFFEEKDGKSSSARLVGIYGFFAGILLSVVVIVGAVCGREISPAEVTTIGLVFTHSGWALKIRTPSIGDTKNANPEVKQGA